MNRFHSTIALLFIPTFVLFADEVKMTQGDVDSIVWEQIGMLRHDEHCQDAIYHEVQLKRRGATDGMLSSSYAMVIQKTVNSTAGSDGDLRFGNAAWGFSRTADSSMLTNLLGIAEICTNETQSAIAICAYHDRVRKSIEFAGWARGFLLKSKNVSLAVKYAWECLTQDYFSPNCPKHVKNEIEAIARDSLGRGGQSVALANAILLARTKCIAQSEIDEIIDGQILLLNSHDDVESALLDLSYRGATQEMIARAFVKVLKRDMNCGAEEVGLQKAVSAIYWFSEYATDNDVTNFVFFASEATNGIAGTAWSYFSQKTKNRAEVVLEGVSLLKGNNAPGLHSRIWDVFEQELDGRQKQLIVNTARQYVQKGLDDAYRADMILCRGVSGYASSPQHLRVMRSLTSDERFKARFPGAYEKLKIRMSSEAGNETN